MSNQNPMRVFSRTVAGAIENSPQVEAFLDGRPFVPNTWGGYATRAIDLDLAEPTPAAVTDLLVAQRLSTWRIQLFSLMTTLTLMITDENL